MPNKIDSSLTPYRQIKGAGDSPNAKENSGRSGATSNPAGASDTVAVTSSARQLASLESAISAASVEDSGRIDAVRQQLADGRYQVDPQRVADSILSLDQSLPAGF